uniref:Integrase catalytic domain-containing protein n=1 Tax=Hyaloperonospora arabidopsidis (strain Emoy2) TaxID=559515 RepID=M4B3I6_HYAAE
MQKARFCNSTSYGNLAFEKSEHMACNSEFGIRLTSNKRIACVSCLEGKQTRNEQPHRERGANSAIDTIDGVICPDFKRPMTPKYRLSNRYLVNFIDHKSNHFLVFLARTKDAAAEKFESFFVHLEKPLGIKKDPHVANRRGRRVRQRGSLLQADRHCSANQRGEEPGFE